jgi:cupin 2 domain-containing protein
MYKDIPHELPVELFETLYKNAAVKIERIVSKGHITPKDQWYDQDQDEWVLVLTGEANIAFADGPPVNIKTGDCLLISAHVRHRVEWTPPDIETIWLAIHICNR